MKETEITVQIFNSKEEIFEKLKKLNFTMYEKFQQIDSYYSKYDKALLKELPYQFIMKNSFAVRSKLLEDNTEKSCICYKKKEINESGIVLSSEKIQSNITNIENALQIFELAGINRWCKVDQEVYCFKNNKMDIMVQIVAGLGIFIEYEEDETIQGLNEYGKIELMKNNLQELDLKFGDDYFCKKVYMKFMQKPVLV